MNYNREAAVRYALRYALAPNPGYVFYPDDDCTNFISQCLAAGGAQNDFNQSYPWWCVGKRTSVCWAVAHSLYWYIRTRSEANSFGIKAQTYTLDDQDDYAAKINGKVTLGDLIQYRNFEGRIQHSTMITAFDAAQEPLVCQHTFEGRNVTWRKSFKQVIFHHITGIN